MYVDKNLMVMSAQASYGVATNVTYSAYSIDLLTTGRYGDIGKGKPVAMIFTVDTAFAGTAGAFVTFQVRVDTDLTIDTNSVIVCQTGTIAITALTAGAVIVLPIAAGIIGSTYDHLGASVLISTQTTTAGAVSAFIGFDY